MAFSRKWMPNTYGRSTKKWMCMCSWRFRARVLGWPFCRLSRAGYGHRIRPWGLPEVVQDNVAGLLVAAGNVLELAGAMTCRHQDPSLRRRMAAAAREFVLEHYDWEPTSAIMDDVYLKALSGKPQ